MRLLVYVEPHPIRDAATHFVDVARRFLPLLAARGGLDVRMFANAATLDLLGDAGRPVAARLIRTTAAEEEVVAGHLVPWEAEGIAAWRDLMAGRGQVTEDHLGLLRRVWSRFPFDAIVHWGENGAVGRFAAERGLLRIAVELGCTRSPFMESLVADPFGTNGAAVVPKLSVAELRDVVEGRPMSAGEALHAYVRAADGGLAERRFAPLPGALAERIARAGRIAFLPLQLFDDANLLRFSPFDTVADVVLHAVPPLVEAGYTVLVKPHPASARRPGSVAANEDARARLSPWAAGVVWCDPEVADDNARLIELADLVVTVNSSVGFEALYFDKPVVVLGDAVYKPRDLFPTLDAVLGGGFDPVAYRDGAGYLRRFLLGGYLQAPTATSDGGAFERVAAALAPIARGGTGDPVAVARSLWQVGAGPGRNRAEARIRAGIPEFSRPPEPGRDAVRSTPRDAASLADYDGALVDWMPVARRLLHHAGSTDLSGFTAWLDARLADAAGVPEIVRVGAIVDPAAYLDVQVDVRDGRMDPLGHYVRHGFREARQLRRGMPRLLPDAIRALILRAAALALAGTRMPEEPLPPAEAEHRRRSLGAIAAGLSGGAARIAVVAHLADRDLAPALLGSLRAIPEPFDLLATLPDWGAREIRAALAATWPRALVHDAPDRGGDVGAFVDLLPVLLARGYDAVLKLRTGRDEPGPAPRPTGPWQRQALDALVGGPARVADILAAFRTDPALAMVGPEPQYRDLPGHPPRDRGALARALIGDVRGRGWFAGAAFWVRPRCLAPIVGAGRLTVAGFAEGPLGRDGALAGVVERLFGHVASVPGATTIRAPVDPTTALPPPDGRP